jgi:hypothetical protein
MICVYRHIRLDKNEPFYIGIGSMKRAYSKQGRNVIWKNIVKKTEYRVDILFEDLTREEACEKEIEFIKLYGRKDLGTGTLSNRTDGGEGTGNHSNETKLKISLKKIGSKRPDVSFRNVNFKLSDETKMKISKANSGKVWTENEKMNVLNGYRNSIKKRIKGVYWCNTEKCWISKINKNKKTIHIGFFNCFAKALIARKKAEIEIWDNDKDHFIKKRIKGINWDKRRKNWQVRNVKNGKNNYIGSSQHFCKALMMLKKSKEG